MPNLRPHSQSSLIYRADRSLAMVGTWYVRLLIGTLLSIFVLSVVFEQNILVQSANAQASVPKRVVQNRREIPTYEWTLAAGVLPLDAFKKGLTAGGSLTIHQSHRWAWEALSLAYSFELKTDLEDQLQTFYSLQPTPFERVKLFALSNLVFKPLYWKGSWLNQKMAYGELLLVAGGGYGWLSQTSRPAFDAGFAIKLLHENEFASRLDVRMISFFNAEDIHNELWVNLGFSL
ncbi:MAG: hypothetical protein CMH49_06950 [Myxococcales bacterium]|nr:hypothetical protein [Myxococcales bacterium]